MSKYQEMSDAAAQGRKDFIIYQGRSWQNLATLVAGLRSYCEIPPGQIKFLRWNGLTGDDRSFTEPHDGGKWSLPGAITFEEEDEYWHLGVCVTLTNPGTFPENWFSFELCVSERQGQLMVKIGVVGTPRVLDLSDAAQCADFYDEIVNDALERISEPRSKSRAKKMGFEIPPYETGSGVKEE
jgi:hypothetical protein